MDPDKILRTLDKKIGNLYFQYRLFSPDKFYDILHTVAFKFIHKNKESELEKILCDLQIKIDDFNCVMSKLECLD